MEALEIFRRLEIFRSKVTKLLNKELLTGHFDLVNEEQDYIMVSVPFYRYKYYCYELSGKIMKGYTANEFVSEFKKNFRSFVLNSIFRKN